MSTQLIQFNRRSLVSLALAILVLLLAAVPALAWVDEGDVAGQAAVPCRVITAGSDGPTVYCMTGVRPQPAPVVAGQFQPRPSIAKAELRFMAGPDTDHVSTASR